MMTLLTDTTTQTTVRVPTLVMFAIPHVHDRWMDDSTAATPCFGKIDEVAKRQAAAIQKSVPDARVVRLRGMHYLFLSNTADVLREIRAFTARLG